MDFPTHLASVRWPAFPNVSIVRGDLLHPVVSGNKLFKLQPFLQIALTNKHQTLISVGGRFSNHLHALAYTGHQLGLKTVGLVRGFDQQDETQTLRDCKAWGMQIHFIKPNEYEQRYSDAFWAPWLSLYPNALRIDEGGWSEAAVISSGAWWQYIPADSDMVLVAIGSGSTLAGLVKSRRVNTKVVGVPAFKDGNGYQELIEKLKAIEIDKTSFELWSDYVERGFGKLSAQQRDFKANFEAETDIPLDPVYTTKVLFTLLKMMNKHPELLARKISVLHTGGLQGNQGA